jgi:uncharacterized protein (DUF2147 family)
MKYVLVTLLTLLVLPAFAQPSPVGLWKTVDDATGREKGLVRIDVDNGVLTGRIAGNLDPTAPPHRLCDLCTDERKGKPLLGLTILRGVRASADEAGVWDGGDILDPDNGKVYRVRLRPSDDGKTMEVRGYIGFPLLGRTQIWTRTQ